MAVRVVDGCLLCPGCGSIYLHHDRVSVYARGEDEKQGLCVHVDTGDTLEQPGAPRGVRTGTDLTGNPSGRRGGLVVRFWCEECHATSELSLAQHKGQTDAAFDVVKEPA